MLKSSFSFTEFTATHKRKKSLEETVRMMAAKEEEPEML